MILQTCSRNFLIDPLPDDWYELTKIEQDDFLCHHAWQPLEYFSAKQLWHLIDNSADTFYTLLSSHHLLSCEPNKPSEPLKYKHLQLKK